MAERVARKQALVAGLTDVVFTSAATSTDEIGHPIDPRGRRVLERAGYEADGHSAHQITTEEIAQAELVVVMEQLHIDLLLRRAPQATNLVLLTDFDPAHRGEPVDDPWFGPDSAFDVTLAAIESALPGLFDYLKNPSGLAEAV
jgi:protein-tyrosine phosphatase